jgi:hypothetical protein
MAERCDVRYGPIADMRSFNEHIDTPQTKLSVALDLVFDVSGTLPQIALRG